MTNANAPLQVWVFVRPVICVSAGPDLIEDNKSLVLKRRAECDRRQDFSFGDVLPPVFPPPAPICPDSALFSWPSFGVRNKTALPLKFCLIPLEWRKKLTIQSRRIEGEKERVFFPFLCLVLLSLTFHLPGLREPVCRRCGDVAYHCPSKNSA